MRHFIIESTETNLMKHTIRLICDIQALHQNGCLYILHIVGYSSIWVFHLWIIEMFSFIWFLKYHNFSKTSVLSLKVEFTNLKYLACESSQFTPTLTNIISIAVCRYYRVFSSPLAVEYKVRLSSAPCSYTIIQPSFGTGCRSTVI